MAPAKELLCKKCGNIHKRPINSKCTFHETNSDSSDVPISDIETPSVNDSSALNLQILAELKSLGGRMSMMEEKMASRDARDATASIQQATAAATGGTTATVQAEIHSTSQLDQVVIPTLATLQGSQHIQTEVDKRLRQLGDLNESGKSKSQRGVNEIVWVKRQVPWPQNFVLGGSNKGRMSYDLLNWCQWVAGFATIAREEQNVEIKNSMLEYLTEIMEDANDFGWQSAKASHAVLLCRMEDGKIDWSETQKIDRIRRAHAQRGVTQSQGGQNSKSIKLDSKPAMACRFYQKGLCHNQRDHETGGTFYKHVCANCFSMGRENRHMSKDCKVSSRNSKNE